MSPHVNRRRPHQRLDELFMLAVVSGGNQARYFEREQQFWEVLLASGLLQAAVRQVRGGLDPEELDAECLDLYPRIIHLFRQGLVYGFSETYLVNLLRTEDDAKFGEADPVAADIPDVAAPAGAPSELTQFGATLTEPVLRDYYEEWLREGKVLRHVFSRKHFRRVDYRAVQQVESELNARFFARFQKNRADVDTRPAELPLPELHPRSQPVITGAARRALAAACADEPGLQHFIQTVGAAEKDAEQAFADLGLKPADGWAQLRALQPVYQDLVEGQRVRHAAWRLFVRGCRNKWGAALVQEIIASLPTTAEQTDMQHIALVQRVKDRNKLLNPAGDAGPGRAQALASIVRPLWECLCAQLTEARLIERLTCLGALLNDYRKARLSAAWLWNQGVGRPRHPVLDTLRADCNQPAEVHALLAPERPLSGTLEDWYKSLVTEFGWLSCVAALVAIRQQVPDMVETRRRPAFLEQNGDLGDGR